MKEIQNLLLRISHILKENDEIEWSNVIQNLYEESFLFKDKNYDFSFMEKITSLYGGMGSFNDIVLQKDGKSLVEQNDDFYRLKHELYEKCIEMRISKDQSSIIKPEI